MRLRAILATTPMRLTLRLVALFVVISLVAFAITWRLSEQALIEAGETTLEQQIAELSAAKEPAAIARAVADAARRADGEHLILHYEGPQGVAGNYTGPLPGHGLRLADLKDKTHDIDGRYLLLGKDVAGGRLTAGQDAGAFDELAEILWLVLGVVLLPTALLVLAGGVLIALRAAGRLTAIEATLDRLAAGDLAARLPAFRGPADDLSRVGAGIDRLAAVQEESVAALRQVSADIAHDLKTPIQRLAVILDEARTAAPDLQMLDRAGEEIDGIVATFHALLRIAQIEGGAARAHFAPVALGPLAASMAELYEPSAEESGHRIDLRLNDPVSIPGDRTLLGQMIANLIENALRHSPPGPVVLDVSGARVSVADHGPGIPEAERKAVLRRLYRLDHSRSTPGNGLGLALVEAIVKLHGGQLDLADNAPGLRVTASFGQVTDR